MPFLDKNRPKKAVPKVVPAVSSQAKVSVPKNRGRVVGTVSDILNLWNCKAHFHKGWEIALPTFVAHNYKMPFEEFQQIKKEILAIPVLRSGRVKRVAGLASYKDNCIIMHEGCFDKTDHLYDDRLETFFHELAHHLAFRFFKKEQTEESHPPEWQFCMSVFGFIPYVTAAHNMDYRGYKERQLSELDAAAELFADANFRSKL